METLVVSTRSNRIDSVHMGHICAVNPDRDIVLLRGDSDAKVFMRSSAKPFQAIAFVNSGAMREFDIDMRELAVICSSHNGEEMHRETVSSILRKIGLNEEHLRCGAVYPFNSEAKNELIKHGRKPNQLYNTCSGKHAGMLAVCRYYGYPVEGYIEPGHPVQQRILKISAELLECRKEDIIRGTDGCNIPTYMVTLRQAAYMYSLLAGGVDGNGSNGSNGSNGCQGSRNRYAECFSLIREAMTTYPDMISGPGEFCSELIAVSGGGVIGKIGANGLYCMAVPGKALGICIKLADGNAQRLYPAAIQTLKCLDALNMPMIERLSKWEYPVITNHEGVVTGRSIPVFAEDMRSRQYRLGDEFVPDTV